MTRWTISGKKLRAMVLPGITLLLAACQPSPETNSNSNSRNVQAKKDPGHELTIYTVNYPLAYFAEKIGGKNMNIVFPAPHNTDPAYWAPDPETIVRYQRADLIILNGAGYAAWTHQATLPLDRLIDTTELLADQFIAIDDAVSHGHGPEGKHTHGSIAFTTWLNPRLAIQQARSVTDALGHLSPDHTKKIETGFGALEASLNQLDQNFQVVFDRVGDRPLLFSHPVYQYLIQRYGINARSLHWEPGQQLTDVDLADLATTLQAHPATVMIWESEPGDENRKTLESSGITSIVFSTAANVPESGDYMDVMRSNLAGLQSAFRLNPSQQE